MAAAQTEEDELQDDGLEEEVHPNDIEEGREVEDGDAEVEGEGLTGGHQGMTATDEGFAEGLGDGG